MKKFLTKLEWIFDYYFAYLLFNGNKLNRYYDYMCKKYPGKFEDCVDRKYEEFMKD